MRRRRPDILRVETSFQDTPGNGYYFVLLYEGRPLADQIVQLGLRDGDTIILWEPDCGDISVPATLMFDFEHPMMFGRALWAKEIASAPPNSN